MLFKKSVSLSATVVGGALVCAQAPALGQCAGFPQAPYPVQEGMSMLTCFSGFVNQSDPNSGINGDGFVIAVVDTRDPECDGAMLGQNWCAPMFHNEFPITADTWTSGVHSSVSGGVATPHLGQVFGITHDDQVPPNFYVSATTVYGNYTGDPYQFGAAGAGGIYEISGATGAVSTFATLPNASGASLGNLVFDAVTQRIYATNMDDGLIYSIPVGGGTTYTFDHGVDGRPNEGLGAIADDPAGVFTQLGRRVWGVHVYDGRLYYAVYWEDQGQQSAAEANEVWSVALNGGGGNPFNAATAQLELSVPVFQGVYSNPVASIAFSSTGKMLLAERVKSGDYGQVFGDAHSARVLEYELVAGNWVPSANDFFIGNFSSDTNSTGGADYDCQLTLDCGAVAPIENVWATGDALNLGAGQAIYGLQRTPPTGNVAGSVGLTSIWVDLDGVFTTLNKTQTGDVEVYCLQGDPCMTVTDEHINCNADDPSKVTYTATITNNSGVDAEHVTYTVQSPAGQLMVTPNMHNISIPDGSSATISVTVMGINGLTDLTGEELCFSITLLDATLEACCSTEVCISPDCDCFEILTSELKCVEGDPWKFTWTFEFVNLTNDVVEHLYFFPAGGLTIDTPEAVDNYIAFDPGLNPGQSSGPITVTLCFDNQDLPPAAGTLICFPITIHDQFLLECCAGEHCLEIPECNFEVVGGCCLCDGTCVDLTADDCASVGLYLGDGVLCGTPGVICDSPASFGACCFEDSCVEDFFICECEASMGVFLGPGSTCDECDVTPTGACCRSDGTCVIVTMDECELIAGLYLGDGSACDECPAGPAEGVCCYTDFCDDTIAQANCEATGGSWLPAPATCDDCPLPLIGDCNDDGKVDSLDLNILLSEFGQQGGYADLNGDGTVNSPDLNILLAAFGAGVE